MHFVNDRPDYFASLNICVTIKVKYFSAKINSALGKKLFIYWVPGIIILQNKLK